jgi:GNAT superfamily N-acetyltransferase
MELQTASLESVSDLIELVNSAFRGDSSREGWTTEADLLGGQRIDRQMLTEMIENPRIRLLLVRSEVGTLRACLYLEKLSSVSSSASSGTALIGMITVRPGEQGKGLGRQILAAAEEWARDNWNIESLEMTVIRQREELIQWYLRRGYALTAERKPFPYGQAQFGEPLRTDLEFVVLRKSIKAESHSIS